MNFVAIDVETANESPASICAIGIVRFRDAEIAEEWTTLVDPQSVFRKVNIGIHGITAARIEGSPTFRDIAPTVFKMLGESVVVSHGWFDRTSLEQACDACGMARPTSPWINTADVAREAWPELARSDSKLPSVCALIGHEYTSHVAIADARAAGLVLVHACRTRAAPLDYWIGRRPSSGAATGTSKPRAFHRSEQVKRKGRPGLPLSGHSVVFTGEFTRTRSDLADMLAELGCEVCVGVSRKTTILFVGTLDPATLVDGLKSGKQREVEARIAAGEPVQILDEPGLWSILEGAQRARGVEGERSEG